MEEVLEKIGLTQSEASIYLALLELGSSTTGQILKRAKISPGKIYVFLDRLIQKGLVSYVIKSGVKYFQALDPERLFDFTKGRKKEIEKDEKELTKILPKLKQQYESKKYERRAEIYEGWKGFTTLSEWIFTVLKNGDTINIFGVSKEAYKKYGHYFTYWTKKRIKLGIKMRIIYSKEASNIGKTREVMPLTEVRYVPKRLESPAFINLFKDYIITYNLHGEPICFLIKDKESAEFYKRYFEEIWKRAKSPKKNIFKP